MVYYKQTIYILHLLESKYQKPLNCGGERNPGYGIAPLGRQDAERLTTTLRAILGQLPVGVKQPTLATSKADNLDYLLLTRPVAV